VTKAAKLHLLLATPRLNAKLISALLIATRLANRVTASSADASTNQRPPTGISGKGANRGTPKRTNPGANRCASLRIAHTRAAGHCQQRQARNTYFPFASHRNLLGDCQFYQS
jgi:hypothetical protein